MIYKSLFFICRSALFCCCLLWSHSLFAWGPLGHEAICDATWRLSLPATKKRLAKAAKRMGYKTFAESCVWADHVRGQDQYDWLAPLHYVNVSRSAKTVVGSWCLSAKNSDKPACVLVAIPYFKQRLDDQSLPQSAKDKALVLLGHFLGDLHQPLHVSFADDRGGTLKKVVFQGKALSLHRLWDSEIISCRFEGDWRVLGKRIYQQALALNFDKIGTVNHWADESLAITHDIYRDVNQRAKTQKLKANYCDQYHGVALEQMAKAAVRLAKLLTD